MNMSKIKSSILDRYGLSSTKELKITDFLFKDCDNGCDFCFENDSEFKNGCKNVPSFSDITEEYISKHLLFIKKVFEDNKQIHKMKFNVMGGELFFPCDIRNVKLYFSGLIDILEHYKDKLCVQVVSNLIHNNSEYIVELLKNFKSHGIRCMLNTSFDFGNLRFKTEDRYKLFKNNMNYVIENKNKYDLDVGCGIILTRNMLKSLLDNDDQCKTFENIISNIKVDFAKLSGDYDYRLSYEEIVDLWKLMVKRYAFLMKDVLYKEKYEARCCLNNKHILITGNEKIDSCISYVYQFHNKNKECELCKHDGILVQTTRNGCLNCKYFGHCVPQCPLDNNYDKCELKPAIDLYLSLVNSMPS